MFNELDVVLLKNGMSGTILEVYADDHYLIEIVFEDGTGDFYV